MKVACFVDSKNKVQHNRVKMLQTLFRDVKFKVIVANKKLKFSGKPYKVIYYCSYGLFVKCPVKHPSIRCSITSHKSIDESDKTKKILKNMHRISTNNNHLYEYFKANNVHYIPNGVDVSIFSPSNDKHYDPNNILFGWVGNKDRATKNFNIIQALGKHFNISLVASSKSKLLQKNQSQMVDFYRSIDFLLVSSSTEGTPNPALEAASCGVPVITTHVGNMPDLIIDEDNGFFVDKPCVDSFKNVLYNKVKNVNDRKYREMSQSIRNCIVEKWQWKHRKELFNKFLF